MNIADGVYNAFITAAAVYEKNGLKLELLLSLCDENGNRFSQTGNDGNEYPLEKRMFYTLISNGGAVNTNIIKLIKAWAPAWDGVDPFWFTDVANTDAIGMVECTIKTEPSYSEPGKSYQNVKFINELGHAAKFGGGSKPVQSGDRAAIMAKYGAKFKAAAQATMKPVAASALKKPAPAPVAAKRPRPPRRPVRPRSPRPLRPRAIPAISPGLPDRRKCGMRIARSIRAVRKMRFPRRGSRPLTRLRPARIKRI